MTEMRSIDIDFDVHKHIEQARQSFAETPNEVLRRLLGIDKGTQSHTPVPHNQNGRAWQGKGVILPHGTQARFQYNGRLHEAAIEEGEWHTEKGKYNSPSGAAISVARTKSGKRTQLDGWALWEVKRPEDKEWKRLHNLRFK